MIASWAGKYVGIPWRVHGRDRDGIDCWGLVCLVYREVLGLEVPSFAGDYEGTTPQDAEHIAELFAQRWPLPEFRALDPDELPAAGDVVLFRLYGLPCHVGIYVGEQSILHVRSGVDACVERIDGPTWRPRVVGLFRHRGLVPVALSANPLMKPGDLLTVPEGLTVAEVLDAAIPGHDHRVGVLVDGRIVPPCEWPTTRLRAGELVQVRCAPRGDVGRMILTIAVIAWAGAFAGRLASSWGWSSFGRAMLTGGLSAIGLLAVNAICPPPKTPLDNGAETSTAYSITGARNQLVPYGVVPIVLGTHRLVPPYAAQPYTELVGDDQFFRCLFTCGPGPLTISDLKIGTTAIDDFDDVTYEVRTGGSDDAAVTLFPSAVTEEALSVELTQAGSWQTRTSAADADYLSVDFSWPQGCCFVNIHGERDTIPNFTIAIEYRAVGDVPWTACASFVESFQTLRPIRRGYGWAPPARGQYEVRVRRVTADGCEGNGASASYWTALRSTTNEDPVNVDGLSKIAIRIRATGQLNGVIDEFNCLCKSKVTSWNGAAWVPETESANPADLYRAILQGPGNARPVADSRIDLTALQTWADACTAAGWKFNAVLDKTLTVQEALKAVCAAGRAGFAMDSAKYSVVQDVARSTRTQLWTPRNSRNLRGAIAYHEQPHGLKIRFPNENNDYLENERIIYDDGYTALNATKFETIECFGVTDPDLIWKHARFWLASQRLRRERWTLETDFEHLACQRGNLVGVVNDVPLAGVGYGRAKRVTADLVELDAEVEMTAGTDYGIQVRTVTGTITQWDVLCEPGPRKVIHRDPGAAVFSFEEGDLVVLGTRGSEVLDCLVAEVEMLDDLAARVHLIPYNAAVYTADAGSAPAFTAQMTYPLELRPIQDPRSLSARDYLYLEQGLLKWGVTLAWRHPEDYMPGYYEAQIRRPGDGWQPIGTTHDAAIDTEILAPGLHAFRVRSVSGIRFGDWVQLDDQNLDALVADLDDVTGFHLAYSAGAAVLIWEAVSDFRPVSYEIRLGGTWSTARVVATTTEVRWKPAQAGTYSIKAKSGGAYSTNAVTCVVSGTILEENVAVTVTEHPAWAGTYSGGCLPTAIPTSWDVDWDGTVLPKDATPPWDYVGGSYNYAEILDGTLRMYSDGAGAGVSVHSLDTAYAAGQIQVLTGKVRVQSGLPESGANDQSYLENTTIRYIVRAHVYDGHVKLIGVDEDGGERDYATDTTLERTIAIVVNADGTYCVTLDGVAIFEGQATDQGVDMTPGVEFGRGSFGAFTQSQYWRSVKYSVVTPGDAGPHLDGRIALTGYYTTAAANQVDLGYVAECRLSSTLASVGGDLTYDLLALDDLLLEADLLSGNDQVSAIVEVRTAGDDAVWSDWAPLSAGIYYARHFDFRLRLEVPADHVVAVTEWAWTVDMPDRIDDGEQLLDAGGTAIAFDPAFQAAPHVVGTIQGITDGDELKITSVATTGFTAQARNGGSGVARTIHWYAKGY